VPLTYLEMLALWGPVVLLLAALALYLSHCERAALDEADRMRRGIARHNESMDALCALAGDCGVHGEGCRACPRQFRLTLYEEQP
jgi:hypothetical protein